MTPDMDLRLGRCNQMPYNDPSMNVVTACMSFHHFDDKEGFLKEAQRVLTPGGHLYICDPRLPKPVIFISRLVFRLHNINAAFYSNRQLIRYVEAKGFHLIKNEKKSYVQCLCFEC